MQLEPTTTQTQTLSLLGKLVFNYILNDWGVPWVPICMVQCSFTNWLLMWVPWKSFKLFSEFYCRRVEKNFEEVQYICFRSKSLSETIINSNRFLHCLGSNSCNKQQTNFKQTNFNNWLITCNQSKLQLRENVLWCSWSLQKAQILSKFTAAYLIPVVVI